MYQALLVAVNATSGSIYSQGVCTSPARPSGSLLATSSYCSLIPPGHDLVSSTLLNVSNASPFTHIVFFSQSIAMPFGASYPVLIASVGVATLIYFVASKMFGHDPREPPLAPQSIPIVGHMIGLSQSKFNYYVDLRYHSSLINHINSLQYLLTLSQPADRVSSLYHVTSRAEDVCSDET